MNNITNEELNVLMECKVTAPYVESSSRTHEWYEIARSLVGSGLLREHVGPVGSSYWTTFSITPKGLQAIHR